MTKKKKVSKFGKSSKTKGPLSQKQLTIVKTLNPMPRKSSKHVKKTNQIINDNISATLKMSGPKTMERLINSHLNDYDVSKKFLAELDEFKKYYLPPISFISSVFKVLAKNNRKQDAKRLLMLLNNYWIPRSVQLIKYSLEKSDLPSEDYKLSSELYSALHELGICFGNEYRHLIGDYMPATTTAAVHKYFLKHYPKVGKELVKFKDLQRKRKLK